MENKKIEQVKKIKLDIDVFKESYNSLVIDGQESIEDALSLQRQVKAAKGSIKAATELEWSRKKKAYDESKLETDKKKKEYQEIRDKRNTLMNACADIFSGIKNKIDHFQAECVRKAEEERKAKEQKERLAREKEEAEKIVESENKLFEIKDKIFAGESQCKTCGGIGNIMESEDELAEQIPCPDCNVQSPPQENTPTDPGLSEPIETTATETPNPTQKPEEGQKRGIMREFDIEVYDKMKLLGAIIRGERGATLDMVTVDTDILLDLAGGNDCKPGDIIITGVRLVEVDHGDLVT